MNEKRNYGNLSLGLNREERRKKGNRSGFRIKAILSK